MISSSSSRMTCTTPRAIPGETPTPWNRVSPFSPSPLIRRRVARLSIFVKARLDELLNFIERPGGIRSFAADLQFRALPGGQHHQSHNAFAIDLFIFFFDPDVAAVAAGYFNEKCGWSRVETEAVHDGDFFFSLLRTCACAGFSIKQPHAAFLSPLN